MSSDDRRCTLCDLPVREDGIDDAGEPFCCHGCRQVYETLGDIDDIDRERVRERRHEEPTDTIPDDHESTFLEVNGMYCTTCEAFIESAAMTREGVSAARASYVTETVRIDHDPEAVASEDVADAVSGLGYTAYARDDAFHRRQADNWAFGRLAVGVLVGMMVMLQYVLIIYPTYFGGLFYDDRTAQFLADMMAASGGTYFFIVIGILTSIVLLFTGKPILRGAYVSLRTRSPNMDLLIALAAGSAYLYSVLTILTGGTHIYFDVTVAIIVIVTIGNYHESSIKREATDMLADLTRVQVDHARRIVDGEAEEVPIGEVSAGERVLVRAGERVPVDGAVVDGEASTDEAVVTGESLPVHKASGDQVIGGSVVMDGALIVVVNEHPTNSLDRIANLVWDLQSSAHGIQKLADKLATIFVPVVLALAVAVAGGYLLFGASPATAMLVGLTVLIVSCPCALGLATPLAVAAGVREALERNVVVFDETVFERLRGAETVVFDKTGTLTTGDLEIVSVDVPVDVLRLAATLESRSAHPVARAITNASNVRADGGTITTDPEDDATDRIESFEGHARGVSGVVEGDRMLVGHPELFAEYDWPVPEDIRVQAAKARGRGELPVIIGRDGVVEGVVVLGDRPRDGWAETGRVLHDQGIDVVVLSGDDGAAVDRFREEAWVDRVFAGVPPEGKAATVARLAANGRTVMVGDGTNDAPALAQADLGIALGGGTAMAVDAADIAIVDNELRSVETVFGLSRAAGRRVKENIAWAFCYNVIAIPLAITGLLNPLFAAAAMATSSVLVVSNSSRSLLDD